jgi:class 3 adenylate cyclase
MAADERKPVTVLFADLAGSTELATRHDPEQLRALMSAFFDEMRQQIEAFGGTVEKFAGDAVMAVFGVPRVNEDDAERAVRAAIAMQESLGQLNPMFEAEYGARLVLRIGIATGEAVAASRAVNEFMVSGEVPNLAARLQAVGEGITISATTHSLLATRLDVERLEALSLKGFASAVVAYRLRGLRATERRHPGITGLASPIVGRAREQATLSACLEDLRRGRGQVVFVVGEAGIGKSRLKIEQRDHLPDGLRWLEGRCQSYTQSTSYAPIIEILRAALGLAPGEAPAIARAKFRAASRAHNTSAQSQDALAHLLGIDLGKGPSALPGDPRALQSQLVLATRALLQGIAHRSPLIVAVEDLHWADPASVDLLTVLLELTDFQPIMILVTSRPDTEGDGWGLRLQAERNFRHRLTELRLAPLAEDESQQLADHLLRISDLPEAMREQILARAEGNPLFLEEIVRGLIEEGVLRRDGDRWVATGSPERWAIPTTLRGMIGARIDRLPDPAKTLLQHAAVIGRFFGYRTLQALSGDSIELDPALAHLLRVELIREFASSPERQYIFKHALTQEAAEASLLADQRRDLHGRVARYLQTSLGESASEQAAVLAHHWYHAAEWDKALDHTLAAAKRAQSLYDRPAASGHYWRALELFDRLPRTEDRQRQHAQAIETLVMLPGYARDATMVQRAVEHLDAAVRSASERGDAARLARIQALRGAVLRDEGLLKEAISSAERCNDPLAHAFARDRYGFYLGSSGRWDDALAQFGRSMEMYAEQGARVPRALVITYGARCYSARSGRLGEAVRYALEFRKIASELNDPPLLAIRAMEAEPYFYQGAWDDVIRVAEESLPIGWRIGETNVILFGSAWLGLAYLKVGRLADARRVTSRAIEEWQSRRDSTAFSLTYVTIASALSRLASGETDAALEGAHKALDYADRSNFRLEQGAARRVLGQAYAAIGNVAGAEAAVRESGRILEEIRSLPELGQTLLAYGELKRGSDPVEGRALIERARGIFQQIAATGWVVETEKALNRR